MNSLQDEDIIEQILAGDINRYSVLMQKYNQRLYRVCKGYLQEEAEIEDVMQETYVKAFLNLKSYEGRSAFSTWLTRILINETLQRIRNMRRRPVSFKNDDHLLTLDLADHINPEEWSMKKELRNIIEKNVEDLPEKYRLVFLMREVERMSVRETAEALDITETNVKVRLNRAKELLRVSLMKSYPLEELFEFNLRRCARIAENVLGRIRVLSNAANQD